MNPNDLLTPRWRGMDRMPKVGKPAKLFAVPIHLVQPIRGQGDHWPFLLQPDKRRCTISGSSNLGIAPTFRSCEFLAHAAVCVCVPWSARNVEYLTVSKGVD
jgi:hypothetical protein